MPVPPHRRLAYFQEIWCGDEAASSRPNRFGMASEVCLPGQAGAGSCYNANSYYRLSILAIAETEVGKGSL